ncbi:MAG TPA: cbb3-type cytochrome c oxidase subunit 3 [Rubrivivax sp.]|nr:cbb3-type cytochrome c oxidase subunit 3 [Rubrivivax sp.]
MNIDTLFDKASSIMTLVSFITFIGIVWWSYITHRPGDFDQQANLPFADDHAEEHHG